MSDDWPTPLALLWSLIGYILIFALLSAIGYGLMAAGCTHTDPNDNGERVCQGGNPC